MKHITFHFDVISPYAYLAFEQTHEFPLVTGESRALFPLCREPLGLWSPLVSGPTKEGA